jgi:release factor H-coupled RctB family protein
VALNRRIIVEGAGAALRADGRPINDVGHNVAEVTGAGVLHRKLAATSDRGLVPAPGSRGALSFLSEPLGDIH